MSLAVRRRGITNTTVELRGNLIRFPLDAEIPHKFSGPEAHGESRGPEEPMEAAKMQKPLGAGQLLPDGPNVSWERWFRAFEIQAAQKSIPWISGLSC